MAARGGRTLAALSGRELVDRLAQDAVERFGVLHVKEVTDAPDDHGLDAVTRERLDVDRAIVRVDRDDRDVQAAKEMVGDLLEEAGDGSNLAAGDFVRGDPPPVSA